MAKRIKSRATKLRGFHFTPAEDQRLDELRAALGGKVNYSDIIRMLVFEARVISQPQLEVTIAAGPNGREGR